MDCIFGSSPHTRGAPRRQSRRPSVFGIIPAYAGSTPHDGASMLVTLGSSPHTRGAPEANAALDVEGRIIPAYAGSTTQKAT